MAQALGSGWKIDFVQPLVQWVGLWAPLECMAALTAPNAVDLEGSVVPAVVRGMKAQM